MLATPALGARAAQPTLTANVFKGDDGRNFKKRCDRSQDVTGAAQRPPPDCSKNAHFLQWAEIHNPFPGVARREAHPAAEHGTCKASGVRFTIAFRTNGPLRWRAESRREPSLSV